MEPDWVRVEFNNGSHHIFLNALWHVMDRVIYIVQKFGVHTFNVDDVKCIGYATPDLMAIAKKECLI